MHSLDGATADCGRLFQLQLTIHLSTRKILKGWIGLVAWLTYSGRFIHINGHPSHVGRAQDRENWTILVLCCMYMWLCGWEGRCVCMAGRTRQTLSEDTAPASRPLSVYRRRARPRAASSSNTSTDTRPKGKCPWFVATETALETHIGLLGLTCCYCFLGVIGINEFLDRSTLSLPTASDFILTEETGSCRASVLWRCWLSVRVGIWRKLSLRRSPKVS